ncbi:hypothetical protein K466DRAFT_499999, partial [Polyporus arcularius HHB13444]
NQVHEKYPWIQILPDACHRLGHLCGDICKMDCFKDVISNLRRTLKFFSKSTDAREHLRRKRAELGIRRGLVSIGKTRFASIYHAAASLIRCMPALRELCTSGTINITCRLENLVKVLEPIGKSIECLESTHSTVSDVYLFWLACMASIHDIIVHDDNLETSVKEDIRQATNRRWIQMIEQAPCNVYYTGFFFDPRECRHRTEYIQPLISCQNIADMISGRI